MSGGLADHIDTCIFTCPHCSRVTRVPVPSKEESLEDAQVRMVCSHCDFAELVRDKRVRTGTFVWSQKKGTI